MDRFVVARSELCAIQLVADGALDLSGGEVRENPIGVCLQVDPYDVSRLTSGVRFADNGVNLQATMLPLPTAAESVDLVP